jgi:hypothetical protein
MSSKPAQIKTKADKIFNVIYQDGKFTKTGLELCSEGGIDPKSLLPKQLKDFEVKGQSSEISKMTYLHYEERRQLKLMMINDLYQHIKQSKKHKLNQSVRVDRQTFMNTPATKQTTAPSKSSMLKTSHNLSVGIRKDNNLLKEGNDYNRGTLYLSLTLLV